MKQIDGKATRVQKYDRMFFWYVPLCSAIIAAIGFAALDWNPLALLMVLPGIGIGMVLGVLFRNS